MKIASLGLVAALTLLSAHSAFALGANRDANLKAVTAQQVMQDTHHMTQADDINLHDVHRTWNRVTWQATTPNGEYACTSDDMMRNPTCTHLEGTAK